jgi:hypothetical protein
MNKLIKLECLILDQAVCNDKHGIVNDKVWLIIENIVSNSRDQIRNVLVPHPHLNLLQFHGFAQ